MRVAPSISVEKANVLIRDVVQGDYAVRRHQNLLATVEQHFEELIQNVNADAVFDFVEAVETFPGLQFGQKPQHAQQAVIAVRARNFKFGVGEPFPNIKPEYVVSNVSEV